ncbi:molybdopterin biosynthesis protein [Candidatus Bipolaricaulota bacterium]|nr:molybdopterin biosynthesis protein [Candidatus Bipolaricaulota bacterium]
MRKEFRNLISPEKFESLIDGFKFQNPIERVQISQATNKIVAKDVHARTDVPPFSRSLMDGYAVTASDTYGADEENPTRLEIRGELEIGKPPRMEVRQGKSLEIPTGAEIPAGANAVVMVEDTEKDGDHLLVKTSVVPGENVFSAGSDIATGDLIVREGKEITPIEIAKLAACGVDKVMIHGAPTVGVISTGPELVPPGEELGSAEIYDTNTSLLTAGIEEAGGNPVSLGIVNDDADQMTRAINKGLKNCDLIVSSGSTSAGPHDMIYDILEEQGKVLAHGIKIKPGKPTVLGDLNGIPFFGLPGNPSSAYVIFMNFVAPLIRSFGGRVDPENPKLEARLTERTASEGGRTEQKFVGLTRREDELRAYPINKVSGAITLLSQADGYVSIPEGVNYMDSGETVEVTSFSRNPKLPRLLFVGSNCIGLNRLLNLLSFEVRSLSRGSLGGVEAVENSVADVAGIHIWTPDGYNVPFLRERGVENLSILRGYNREQGLIVQSGNPKGISSVEDLVKKEVRLVNRTSGSGTRILFDNFLERAAEELSLDLQKIKRELTGYQVELSTHNAVSAAVKSGKADVGMGIKSVAAGNGLGFVKLQEEEFDFLCRTDVLSNQWGEAFRAKLQSREFTQVLESLPGLHPGDKTGEIIYSN